MRMFFHPLSNPAEVTLSPEAQLKLSESRNTRPLDVIRSHPAIDRVAGNFEFFGRLDRRVFLHGEKLIHTVLICQEESLSVFVGTLRGPVRILETRLYTLPIS
jgi:hypothetical protein